MQSVILLISRYTNEYPATREHGMSVVLHLPSPYLSLQAATLMP